MEKMIDEVKASVLYVLKDAESRKFSGVYLCGHSAGAHLSSMMLAIDWQAEGVNPTLLKGKKSKDIYIWATRGAMAIVIGNGHDDQCSNPGRSWLHFTFWGKIYIQLFLSSYE